MADNRTMAQMLQAPIEGYEDAIVVPPINANNFELKQPLINLVQSNKFTGRQDPHNHLRFFNKVTSTFRHPEVPNTSIKLLLFPFSLDGEARDWTPSSMSSPYAISELHQLDTFYNSLNSNDQDALDSAAGGNFLDKMPQEGLAIIESKSKVRYSRSRANDSRVSTDAPLSNSSPSNNSFDMQQIAASLEDKMTIKMNKMMNEMKALVVTNYSPGPVKAVEELDNFQRNQNDFQRVYNDSQKKQDDFQKMMLSFMQSYHTNQPSSSSSLPSNTIPNPRNEAKAITTRSGVSYDGPPIPPPVVEKESEATKDTELPSTEDIQPPPFVQEQTKDKDPIEEPSFVANKAKPNLPYPSRLNKQKIREKDDILSLKFMEIFRNLHFELSFADALIHMPKFASMFKKMLNNKDKLIELTKTPLNENCSAVVLKKLPEKLGDPGRFLIPCDFPEFDSYLALPDKVDLIDAACEIYSQEYFGFSDSIATTILLRTTIRLFPLQSPTLYSFDEVISTLRKEADAFIDKMLKRCEDTKLAPNWEKSHFMVKEGIVLGHKISRKGIEVDKAKVDVISKLPHPMTVKGIRSFLGHAGFYRRFIKDFSKISRSMTHLLEKNTPFIFSEDCILAFQTLKKKLTETPILIAPNWDQPFEIMCDASDYAIGTVLGQRIEKQSDLVIMQIIDTKGPRNYAADHLSRLENPYENVFDPKEINETFPLETLNTVTSHDDQNIPWFADIANYHAGNFLIKGMSTQQKRKFFKDIKHYFWDDCNTPKNTTMQRNTTWGATS
ncbi:reverse transcriptase domain-containing protein [Tanacetum coccineum]|uniref:Reverse transcriptase domain-containing protein n=1 Tax=Tanacetum coccineum TaxID=301880 RepID=A0ABQ5GXG2_9ASTR